MTGLRWGAATDVGRVRMVNEDTILASRPMFAVADGMGGAAGGEVASQVALAELRARVENDESLTMESLVDAVQAANRAVYARALDDLHLRGMGTTLTGVALAEHDGETRLVVVNVGDSRTYVVQEGHLQQITRDHTLVEELVEAGEITADEASTIRGATSSRAPSASNRWWTSTRGKPNHGLATATSCAPTDCSTRSTTTRSPPS